MNCKWLIPLLLVIPASMVSGEPEPDIPSLRVTGNSKLSVPADELQLNVGAAATATVLSEAREDVDGRMQAITTALDKIGLKAGVDYKTARYEVSPQWSQRPRGQAAASWVPELLGYTVRAGVQIKTSKLELAGQIIEDSVTAGSNDISGVRFTLSDSRIARADAITQAAKHAIDDAMTLAAATGSQLGRILDMNIGNSGYRPRQMNESYGATRMSSSSSAPVMAPGLVEVTASVTIVYEIESGAAPGASGQE